MIITGSENGDSKVAPTIPSEGSVVDAQHPPPYSPSSEFTNTGDQKPLPDTPGSPPLSSLGDIGPVPPADLPPPCNHLLQRRSNDSIKGVWHVDTAMAIPEVLLAGVEEFDGVWNESDQKARKERKKLEKKGKRRSEDSAVPSAMREIRPNLMLQSKNGSISADVHVVSSDGEVRPALIVVEGHNGSVNLEVRTYALQPLRVFAISQNGTVRVRIPQTFEGAVVAHTKNGSLKFSEPIKSRMTIFSAADTTRGYIGDWQSAGFGTNPNTSTNPSADPPVPSLADPFSTWTGPIVHVHSHNGTVHLSYSDEEAPARESEGGFSSAFKGFMAGLFGGETSQQPARGGGPWGGNRFPWGEGAPWGSGPPWAPGPPPGPFGPGGPFGRGGGPFGPGGGPFGHGGGPFGRGGGPFGRGGGPCGRGGFRRGGGWGCGSSSQRQHNWGGGRVGGPRNEGPSDEKPPVDEAAWDGDQVERDAYGFPKDRKEPPAM